MRKFHFNKTLFFVFVWILYGMRGGSQVLPRLGAQRAGISALSFLKLDQSPRSRAMSGAQIAISGDPYALTWNPAAATDLKSPAFASSQLLWYSGLYYAAFSATFPQKGDRCYGGYVAALTTGDMEKRTEFQPLGTGEYFSATYAQVAVSYAQRLSDRFSYGASMKYVYESLDRFVAHTVLVDLGFLYRTHFKDLQFAVGVYAFGPNSIMKPKRNFRDQYTLASQNFPPPTTFSLGLSMIPWEKEGKKLLTAVQLNHPNDNAENLRIGLEYQHHNFFFLRTGYTLGMKGDYYPTLGVGLKTHWGRHPLQLDYATDIHRSLGVAHQIGVHLILNRDKRDDHGDAK
jgi:hypothetical protein